MARIAYELPATLGFSTELQVYIGHVNYGNHLDNALLLTLVSEARVRFLHSLGHTEADVGGFPIVVGDMLAQYLSQAFHGERLRIDMAPVDLGRCSFDLAWRVSEITQNRPVAQGKTGIVLMDVNTQRAAPIPEAVRAQLVAVQGG